MRDMYDVEAIDRFISAVRSAHDDPRPLESASTRRSPSTAEALRLARELGLTESVSAFGEQAVIAALEVLAHRVAVETHYQLYPEDRPTPIDRALIRLERAGVDAADRATVEHAAQLIADGGLEPTVDGIVGAVLAMRTAA
jgi:hypothetical protein